MAGPLPSPDARRRNVATIPTTNLPASGFTGKVPECPYDLAAAGAAWWKWAWRTPQAAAWDAGSLYSLARRAQLEDDVARLGFGEDMLDLADLLAGADPEAISRVEFALTMLKRSATGKLQIEKEMRELDDKFGLTSKGRAALRWDIVPDAEGDAGKSRAAPKSSRDRRARLTLAS